MDDSDIEVLAARVHQAYLDTSARLGWPVKPENQVPYDELSEDSKELDRASVRAVFDALDGAAAGAAEGDDQRMKTGEMHCHCWMDNMRPCCWCGYEGDDAVDCVERSARLGTCELDALDPAAAGAAEGHDDG